MSASSRELIISTAQNMGFEIKKDTPALRGPGGAGQLFVKLPAAMLRVSLNTRGQIVSAVIDTGEFAGRPVRGGVEAVRAEMYAAARAEAERQRADRPLRPAERPTLEAERELLRRVTEGLDQDSAEAAAARLVLTAMWGDLVEHIQPCTHEGRIDWREVTLAIGEGRLGYLSGGAEALLRIAASLVTGALVDLRTEIGRLGRPNRVAAVRAIAEAARVPLGPLTD